ncbi:MAG: DUF418 domain-containing protein [Acidobacteria bacterium]|nr:DUF418 domain-containing protein [Acidobacteriota bacterium]NIM61624.1 DUF418 domain-containing protein [Acidobacteriota bacterium]NIO58888.1 DUF418 domain-containing protein [Acidobacteriota bacterium]NIQ29939.1 DUF418 domain-containing protein [Acidobacteriota bacterium]NIQ87432.1 DUF418 domain-containing protein [Acidobacteriota bacterium]
MSIGEAVAPVAGAERLHHVDVVRGAAILGILVVNMGVFFAPIYVEILGPAAFDSAAELWTKRAILFFAQTKFYTTFSILFGFGLAIQLERFTSRGVTFGRFWTRRMLGLLAIGLFHAWILWFGDILTWYAICGLLLFLFRNAKPRTLKVWSAILLAFPTILFTGVVLLIAVAGTIPEVAEEMQTQWEEQSASVRAKLDESYERYPVAGFAETLRLNFRQWAQIAAYFIFGLPMLLGIFIIGLLFHRHRLFHDSAALLPKIRRSLMWLIPVAVSSTGGMVLLYGRFDPMIPTPPLLLNSVLMLVGQLSGAFTYIFLLLIAFHSPRTHRFVAPIAAVGRMALTNYLMHTIVFTTLANGYGAGLYGRVSLTLGLLMTLGMFVIQVALSNAWLRRFRFGPMEWLWRSVTYGKFQPMRRRAV